MPPRAPSPTASTFANTTKLYSSIMQEALINHFSIDNVASAINSATNWALNSSRWSMERTHAINHKHLYLSWLATLLNTQPPPYTASITPNERKTMTHKLVVDCSTGVATEVELTAEEIAQREADAVAFAAIKAAEEAAAQAKAEAKARAEAKLAALGLTAEEIAAL
jgi:hypothetical protein